MFLLDSIIYDTFNDIVDLGRLVGFFDEDLIYEFLRLQKIFGRKIVAMGDAPKDAADAVAGSVYHAVQQPYNRNQMITNIGEAYNIPVDPDNSEAKIQNLFTLPVDNGMCKNCVTKTGWWLPETPDEFLASQAEKQTMLHCIICYQYFDSKTHKVMVR